MRSLRNIGSWRYRPCGTWSSNKDIKIILHTVLGYGDYFGISGRPGTDGLSGVLLI